MRFRAPQLERWLLSANPCATPLGRGDFRCYSSCEDREASIRPRPPLAPKRLVQLAVDPLIWMNMTMGKKLFLGFGILVLFVAVSGAVSIIMVQRIDADVVKLAQVEEPLEQAVLEMEINAGEAVRGVLDYVRHRQVEDRILVDDSIADFQLFATEFRREETRPARHRQLQGAIRSGL